MKTFSTFLQLEEKLSMKQWLSSILKIHQISLNDQELLENRIIKENVHIYQYPQDQSLVVHINNQLEYIYNEKEGCCCIHNDGYSDGYHYIDFLLDHQLLKCHILPVSKEAIMITQENHQKVLQLIESNQQLPIIYINYEQVVCPQYLARELRGLAYVLFEKDQEVSELMKMHCQIVLQHRKVAICYLNHDYKTYRFSQKEEQDKKNQRILHNIEMFLKQRQYGDYYDFHSLQKRYLENLKLQANNYEKEAVFHLDLQMKKLEDQKEKYVQLINKLENDVMILQIQNDQIEDELSLCHQYTLLSKGDIQEFYQSEQRDILLDLLEDDMKKKKANDPEAMIIKDILQQNPKEGTRDEYLEQIFKLLVSNYDIYNLKNYGITIKEDSHNHPIAVFFESPRYQSSLSSTPSDSNACRQIYRQLRNHFF